MAKSSEVDDVDHAVVVDKFKLGRKITNGSFGELYQGTNLETGEEVAIKIESTYTNRSPQLNREHSLYTLLQGGTGIPHLKWYGTVESDDRYNNVMVIELLGPSLGDLFNHCNGRFSLKTTLMLALQLLDRVKFVHWKGFLHRDLKPENFVMGLGRRAGRVYLIDYGLAKRYRDLRDHRKHIPYVEDKVGFAGTAIYASVSAHRGIEQSRRDDLESLGYVLMYFLRGSLPWQDLTRKGKTDWRYEKMGEMKVSTSVVESLCEGFPSEFVAYFRYCRELRFEDEPDYEYLKGLFRDLFVRQGFEFDNGFDWTVARC